MSTLNALILAVSFLALNHAETAAVADCKETELGRCYSVHGRYAIYVEGDAIWPIGTHRLLSAADPELDRILEQSGWEDHVAFGDFLVCPTSQYKRGEMQSVCIKKIRNLRIANRK